MSLFINTHHGPIYSGCTVTIHNGETSIVSQQKDAPQPHEVEDVAFEEVGANAPVSRAAQYPFVVPAKLTELNLYTMSEFETMYRDAAKAGAPVFAKFLKQYQKLGILDFGALNKKQIFDELKAYFPDEIQYLYNNFITYF